MSRSIVVEKKMSKIDREDRYCPHCFEAFDSSHERCPQHDVPLISLSGKSDSLEGTVVDGKYEITGLLGVGGMGRVYRASQLPINREVAVKILKHDRVLDPKGVKRFVREAQAASQLSSRYSAMVHDFGLSAEGYLYYTMEVAEGKLLSDLLDAQGAVPVERVLHIAADICNSLADAHGKGIVHRDLKPSNVMLTLDEEGHEIGKVLDFGTAKLLNEREDSSVSDVGLVCGTPDYMSPEQAMARPVDGRSDLYALGVLLFEMLTGRLPFSGASSVSVLLKHVSDDPGLLEEANPSLLMPPGLQDLVSRLLAKDPEDRPDGAHHVLFELRELLEAHVSSRGEESVADVRSHGPFDLELSGPRDHAGRHSYETIIEVPESPLVSDAVRLEREIVRDGQTMAVEGGQLWMIREAAAAPTDERAETEENLPVHSRSATTRSGRLQWYAAVLLLLAAIVSPLLLLEDGPVVPLRGADEVVAETGASQYGAVLRPDAAREVIIGPRILPMPIPVQAETAPPPAESSSGGTDMLSELAVALSEPLPQVKLRPDEPLSPPPVLPPLAADMELEDEVKPKAKRSRHKKRKAVVKKKSTQSRSTLIAAVESASQPAVESPVFGLEFRPVSFPSLTAPEKSAKSDDLRPDSGSAGWVRYRRIDPTEDQLNTVVQ